MTNNKKLIAIKPFIPLLISLIILIIIGIWFNYTYTDKKIGKNQILSLLNREKTATYSIESKNDVLLNKSFVTNIVMNTNGHSVNATGLQLLYQQDSLRVISIDTTESFCQFYPEKKINDTLGTITLSCGSPNPGFSGENTIIKIEFQPLKVGTTTLTVDSNSKILLNDSKGTNILQEYPQKKINVLNYL